MISTLEARIESLERICRELQRQVEQRGAASRSKTYITFAQLAPKLGFHGKRAPGAAAKWVQRRSIPKCWRGNCWVVAEEDVEKSLKGHSFVVSRGALSLGPR